MRLFRGRVCRLKEERVRDYHQHVSNELKRSILCLSSLRKSTAHQGSVTSPTSREGRVSCKRESSALLHAAEALNKNCMGSIGFTKIEVIGHNS